MSLEEQESPRRLLKHQSTSISSTTPRMLQQLTTCVSDESCVKCAFDFDCDDEEFYVIDDDDEDDDYCINNDGAYWKTPGGARPRICTTFYQEEEEIEFTYDDDNYDHETLTTRFSRQTSATLESILGASSSLLSPSANFIIEDLHLLEQTNQNTDHRNGDDDKKHRPTLAKLEGSPTASPFAHQQQPSPHQHARAVQAVVTSPAHYAPSALHQNLNSPTFTDSSPNNHTPASNDAVAPRNDDVTTTKKKKKSPTHRRWSNLSPTFFGSKTRTPSPQHTALPAIAESSADDDPTSTPTANNNKNHTHRRWSNLSPTFFGKTHQSPRNNNNSSILLLLPPIAESTADDTSMSKKSKSTHPSTSTDASLTSSDVLLQHYEEDYHPLPSQQRHHKGVELTLSGSIMELDLAFSESIVEDDDDEENENKSEIIRLDSIGPSSPASSLFFSVNEDDLVILENIGKRKRMYNKFRSKVAAWKRIAMFHLFPHRRTYTRFEI